MLQCFIKNTAAYTTAADSVFSLGWLELLGLTVVLHNFQSVFATSKHIQTGAETSGHGDTTETALPAAMTK